ncbi:MAG: DUF3667 domain-containing protein [Arenimonas sp.]|uniref:DUF3667 domain-containing protein n=1 Tax=Arenimonas sp. TaxID=1872635 RepID=UPI0025BDEF81|nr:DUF3667 domain-containing protein [Arenimonas sp.]MBW8367827.1 DUF3667 domain-containing protein [Arenimonas sp.]
MADACANCGERVSGAYCAACGQKRIVDSDRRLGHLLWQGFEAVTDLDGRFWRSLRALLLSPGRLSREYLDGRRKYWMAPMALFLLANLVYFVLPRTLTDFDLPLSDQLVQAHAPLTRPWVEQRVVQRDRAARAKWEGLSATDRAGVAAGYTLADYGRDYGAQSGNVGKALIILHVPFLALGLALLFWRRRMYFAEHLVVACHQFTFLLLLVPGLLLPIGWLAQLAGVEGSGLFNVVSVAILATAVLHFSISLRRVYTPAAWVWLMAPVPLIGAMLLGNVFVYRFLQFVVTFAIT